jgi:hypothetical protein
MWSADDEGHYRLALITSSPDTYNSTCTDNMIRLTLITYRSLQIILT